MKKSIAFLVSVVFIFTACDNGAKDSVEKADSINKANTDTVAGSNAVVTDEKSSSFLVRAANSGMAEVKLAAMAQEKAIIKDVKDFANMLHKDHMGVNEQVKSIAAARNVTLPATISEEKQNMLNECQKKTGKDFDKEFISQMIKSHEDGINLFEDVTKNNNDVDIRNFADKTLPALRTHLDSARAIQKRYW